MDCVVLYCVRLSCLLNEDVMLCCVCVYDVRGLEGNAPFRHWCGTPRRFSRRAPDRHRPPASPAGNAAWSGWRLPTRGCFATSTTCREVRPTSPAAPRRAAPRVAFTRGAGGGAAARTRIDVGGLAAGGAQFRRPLPHPRWWFSAARPRHRCCHVRGCHFNAAACARPAAIARHSPTTLRCLSPPTKKLVSVLVRRWFTFNESSTHALHSVNSRTAPRVIIRPSSYY